MTKKNEVVASKQTPLMLPEDLMDEVTGAGGLGYSEDVNDSLIPLLGILQDNSAEVKKKHSKYIDGAEAGDMIIRALGRIFKTSDPDIKLMVQPCAYDHNWVEWEGEPGDGAVVNQYPFHDLPEGAKEVTYKDEEGNDRTEMRMEESGNRLVETRYHYAHILDADGAFPVVIPMAGTNHRVSRGWTSQMKQFKLPNTNRKAPAFMRYYELGTVFVQRGSQSWYTYAVTDCGWIGHDDENQVFQWEEEVIRHGLEFFKSVDAGIVKPAIETEVGAEEKVKGDVPI